MFKKLKKNLFFIVIFVSVIFLCGTSKVSALNSACGYGSFSTFAYSGSYGCVSDSYVSNFNGEVQTNITFWNDAGWSALFSKALAFSNNYNDFIYNDIVPFCSLAGGNSCSNNYNNYNFGTYPVNESSVAYPSQPISLEIGNPYVSGGITSRMHTFVFENNLKSVVKAGGNIEVKFYFAISNKTDNDWSNLNNVMDAFQFNSDRLIEFYVSPSKRTLNFNTANDSSNTSEGVSYSLTPVTVNSIDTVWYSFTGGYLFSDHSTANIWHVAEVTININSPIDFQMVRFKYDAHNTNAFITANSFQENLLFAAAYADGENPFGGLIESSLTLTADSNYSAILSDLPNSGRIIFDNSVIDLIKELKLSAYYVNTSSNAIISSDNRSYIGFNRILQSETEVSHYWLNYDFTDSEYNSIALISSVVEERADAVSPTDYYCETKNNKKLCKFLAKLPFISKIIKNNAEEEFKGNYENNYVIKTWVPNDIFTSDISYNFSTNTYDYEYKVDGNIFSNTSNSVNSNIVSPDNLDKSFLTPTLTAVSENLSYAVDSISSDSKVAPFVISFLFIIITLIILKRGVK